MTVYLLRHGETYATEKRLYCGSTDIGLSDNGRSKLAAMSKNIKYSPPENARYITSGMKRCDETMRILFGDVETESDKNLREMDFGEFEMKSYDDLKRLPEYIEWISFDNEMKRTPGGESGNDMKLRVICAFSEIIKAGRDAVIVTHGGVIAAIMAHLFPDEKKSRYEWQCAPGKGYVLTFENTRATYRNFV